MKQSDKPVIKAFGFPSKCPACNSSQVHVIANKPSLTFHCNNCGYKNQRVAP